MKYFIANWKANKDIEETQYWINEFTKVFEQNLKLRDSNLIKIIICPTFPLLFPLKQMLGERKNITIGSQDLSKFESGTYTGEIPATSLKSIVEYAIIGHSERKKYFQETESDVLMKFNIAKKFGIEPIYCVPDSDSSYPPSLNFLCYEPPEAISKGDGRGNFESIENILSAKKKLSLNSDMKFIYGGSVNRDNIVEYSKHDELDGFLVGGASLDPQHFFDIINSSL